MMTRGFALLLMSALAMFAVCRTASVDPVRPVVQVPVVVERNAARVEAVCGARLATSRSGEFELCTYLVASVVLLHGGGARRLPRVPRRSARRGPHRGKESSAKPPDSRVPSTSGGHTRAAGTYVQTGHGGRR